VAFPFGGDGTVLFGDTPKFLFAICCPLSCPYLAWSEESLSEELNPSARYLFLFLVLRAAADCPLRA